MRIRVCKFRYIIIHVLIFIDMNKTHCTTTILLIRLKISGFTIFLVSIIPKYCAHRNMKTGERLDWNTEESKWVDSRMEKSWLQRTPRITKLTWFNNSID